MVNQRDRLPQATESIYAPRPSWGPAFFAAGAALVVCGIFAEGFIVRGWVYMIIGAVVALVALWTMVAAVIRGFRRLPQRQRARGAVLPVPTLEPPRKP